MEFNKTWWSCPWNSGQNSTQNSAMGWWGIGVRVGSGAGSDHLKIDIAERSNYESLLLEITYLNIFM